MTKTTRTRGVVIQALFYRIAYCLNIHFRVNATRVRKRVLVHWYIKAQRSSHLIINTIQTCMIKKFWPFLSFVSFSIPARKMKTFTIFYLLLALVVEGMIVLPPNINSTEFYHQIGQKRQALGALTSLMGKSVNASHP